MKTISILTLLTLLISISNQAQPQGRKGSDQKVRFTNSQGIEIDGYLFEPKNLQSGKKFPAVVMHHGCAGAFSYSKVQNKLARLYRWWGKKLKKLDFYVLLVDSFTPRGAEQRQCGNGSDGVSQVTDRAYDSNAAYDFLAGLPQVDKDNIGILGWSHGGRTVISTLSDTFQEKRYKLGVSFYPGCGLYGAFGGISSSNWVPYADIYILAAELDPLYTGGFCEKRKQNAEALMEEEGSEEGSQQVLIEIEVYEKAQHSFDNAWKTKDKFTRDDVKARKAANAKTIELFTENLK